MSYHRCEVCGDFYISRKPARRRIHRGCRKAETMARTCTQCGEPATPFRKVFATGFCQWCTPIR